MDLGCGQEVRRSCSRQDTVGVAAARAVVGFIAGQCRSTSVTGDLRGISAFPVGEVPQVFSGLFTLGDDHRTPPVMYRVYY